MTLNKFIIGVIVLLFSYNLAITKWLAWQERRRQARLDRRDIRRRY